VKTRMGLVCAAVLGMVAAMGPQGTSAAEIKVLTTGAFKQVVVALVPQFEKATGHKVVVDNGTVGQLTKRVDGGETFDVLVLSPKGIDNLIGQGRIVAGSSAKLAKVGVGVMVKAGAPVPDVSTVEAFKRALLNAKSIAYIDPESGGSSGIYLAKLLERLELAEQVCGKTRLKRGGHVSDLILSGEAELGIHQMSEIVSTAGITLAGPLPADIQNYTTYAAGIGTAVRDRAAAQALIDTLAGPVVAPILAARGMLAP